MKSILLIVVLAAVLACVSATNLVQQGVCVLTPTNSNYTATGVVHFMANYDNTTSVHIVASGLVPNSTHGIHVHMYGDISSTDGLACGGHWASAQSGPVHGFPDNPIRHAGDLGNITADENGDVDVVLAPNDYLSLMGLDTAIGRCVILHEKADNGSAPVGFAGNRMAQCVIGVQSVNTSLYTNEANNEESTYAAAEIKGVSDSNVFGRVTFADNLDGTLNISAKICGLAPLSQHGFHIHYYGDISGITPDANSGSHYNPYGMLHGWPDNSTKHLGDMGNITADSEGVATIDLTLDIITLTGPYNIIGRMAIVHAGPDTGVQPTGNSGTKMAVGVVGKVLSTLTASSVSCPALAASSSTTTAASSAAMASSATNAASSATNTASSAANGASSALEESDLSGSASTLSVSILIFAFIAIIQYFL